MNQWIRWRGLLPFVLIITALLLFFLLFADSLAKSLIESSASDMVGARVETKNVDLHLSPLGIRIDGLQVTNPEQPMSNIVEIEQLRFDLAADKLLLGKLIIERMDVDQVRFDTPRSSSGAIKKPPIKTEQTAKATKDVPATSAPTNGTTKDSGMTMPSLDLPDVDEILAREPLDTQKQADALAAAISSSEQDWLTLQKSLPDETRRQSYQQRIAALGNTRQDDVKQVALALKELQSIKSDLNADIGKINSARNQVQLSLGKLDQDYKALLKAPAADKQRLLQKYSPDAQGVGNLSGLLFGNQAGGYVKQGLYWYQKLAPMLAGGEEEEAPEAERQKGKDIRFREYQPSPDFLIRRIHSSVLTRQGSFEGQILDVTHQPEILRKPVSFEFKGQKMTGIESLHIRGTLDHINRKKSLDQINMDITGYRVSRHSLSSDPNLQLVIASARSQTRLRGEVRNGQLNGTMNIHMEEIKYNNRAGAGEFQQVLVNAFNGIDDFNIDAHLSGSLRKPGLKIASDLDKRLNKQISVAFERRISKYQRELSHRLQQLTDAQIAPVRKSIDTLRSDIESQLKSSQAQYQRQSELIEQRRREYQSRLDTEKRKAERAIKRQLEDKAKALLKKYQK